jgi:hypothetical protein
MTRALLERVTRSSDFGYGPSSPGGWGRRLVIGLGVVGGLAVIVVGLIGMAGGTGRPGREATIAPSAPGPPHAQHPSSGTSSPAPGLVWHTPVTAVPPGTPVQEQYDQAFSQGLGSLSGMAAAEALAVPSPTAARGWPDLAIQVTPERWAEVFTAGLLDVDFARQSRAALAAWLQAEEAPELIPGVPSGVADKVLFISLLDPGLFGGQPTPILSSSQWAANARAGVRQTVSNLIVQADPAWAQMTAAGWQPTDVRMTEEDVSGLVEVHQESRVASHPFTMQLIVGSARWHDGYGTVAVSGWQEQ